MSSVIVKGMKMPDSCAVCRFAGKGGYRMERVVCMFTGKNEDAENVGRLPECPLVALPDKHGRLVDADKMLNRLQAWNTSDRMDKALYNFTWHRIMEQPTIVESEGNS